MLVKESFLETGWERSWNILRHAGGNLGVSFLFLLLRFFIVFRSANFIDL